MDFLNKAPRPLLIVIAAAFFGLAGLVGNNLYADNQQTKKIAYDADRKAETAQMQTAELRGAIQDLKNTEQKDHDETREDLKDLRALILKLR